MRTAPGALRYAGPAALGSLPAFFVSAWLGAGLLALAGGVLWFFRDPERRSPEAGVVSAADGRVSVVREENGRLRVGAFMNVTDVHVNRAPLGGAVESVDREPGGHWPAFSKESERNERVRICFEDHEVVLIAGAFVRRITPYVDPGEAVERGERIAHIAFGSRVDVLLPPEVGRGDLLVAEGDRVRAGETVIARAP